MYSIEQFNERLREEFGGRLRLRRSEVRESTFFIEERTGRGTFTGIADLRDKHSFQARKRADERIRARDGYSKVMEVQAGTKSASPCCNTPYTVPVLCVAERRCPSCDNPFITSFYPIGESLLDYLRKCDPERVDQKRRVDSEEAAAALARKDSERYLANDVGSSTYDILIEQLPTARYSGNTSMWEDAPSSPLAE